MNPKLPRPYILLASGFLAAYFVYFTIGSLLAEFTNDDLMNCYRGWFYPLTDLLADNLLFFRFSPMYRPFGALVYKAFFGPFGFDLFPLRALLWLVLAGNIFLVYKVLRLLTGSVEVGLFPALLHAYHMKLSTLYYNSGTLYDIFAFFFYFAALALYISVRHSGKTWTIFTAASFLTLYILALDSKELAASLPLVVVAYELLWHFPLLEKRALLRWLGRETWIVWVVAVMTAAFAKGRVLNQEGGLGTLGHYGVTISPAEYLTKLAHYLNELFYAPNEFDIAKAAIFAAGLLAVSAICRSRALLFSSVVFLAGMLPMAFIDPRALNAVYIPLAGVSMFGGVLLGFVFAGICRLLPKAEWQLRAFLALYGLTGLFLIRYHPESLHIFAATEPQYGQIREAREQLKQSHPEFPAGSRILILDTPFPQYSPGYNNVFLIQLTYRDQSLQVMERAMLEANGEPVVAGDYDYILSYKYERWFDIDPAQLPAGSGEPVEGSAKQ